MYDWGHHKFMGTVDPNQQIEVKKSARQIYAEAFMEDENPMFRSTQYANFADEGDVKEAQAKWEADQKLTEEERARRAFEEALEDEEENDTKAESTETESTQQNNNNEEAKGEADAEDMLDKLTGNMDEEEADEA